MIEAQNLVKRFGPKVAVDHVSLVVEPGEVLGFLGPNGAGKTTTMRLITGFLQPTEGTVKIGGHDVDDDGIAARSLVGYLPENAPAYPEMSVLAFIRFSAEIRGLRGEAKKKAVARAIEMCFLEPVLHQSIETLSKGYQHRVCFAQAIVHDPPVLILDEPTDGLDPNQKHEIRNLIQRMGRQENKAIIISTHILEEVDAVCSRVAIIDRGKLVFKGKPDELRRRSRFSGAATLRFRGTPVEAVKSALESLPEVQNVVVLDKDGDRAAVRAFPKPVDGKPADAVPAVARLVREKGWEFEELRREEGRLDEVFRQITLSETKQPQESDA